ncbi:type I restriction enzyme S subunit [Kribbella sp. VKM Ac-2571]|uniref:restriction endonuclease subunit S n=1 Tax=Kribbella sp. VKM Ac-2571 TaxID=2512222 RepID=UPI00105D96F3|nr:restriction endonuclease subunit S [Kribbella sp. VKM Ac-2571]TDO66554.1 type I restriction enzyme S subunit [Kribbella sp. VKM Ac-2571]
MTGNAETLPPGWTRRRVGDVLKLRNGYAFKTSEWSQLGRPIIRIQNLKSDSATHNYFDGDLPDRFRADPGDLLFAWSGTPGTSFGAHVWDGPEAWINQHIFRVDFSSEDFDRDFLKLALDFNLNDYISEAQGGVGLAHITKGKLNESQLITPPLDVQRQIAVRVAEISESRASALGHLVRARRSIERFGQAVLAAACSGRLTADWREANPDAQSVEAALAAAPGRKARRTAANNPSDLALPGLPDSYTLTTVGRASTALEYGTSKRAEASPDGIPVLRMGNIQDGRLDVTDLKYCPIDREIERLMLQNGDLLFNRTNSPELVGKAAVFHENTPMTFASYLIRVRFAEKVAEADFVNYWINSAWGRVWARHVKTDGVSQSNINGTKLATMPLPLPPIEEQREIVRRASRMLSLADALLARVELASDRVNQSSQAVLAKAFRGDLIGAES